MAKTDPKLASWMVLEIEADLDRECDPNELAIEIARRVKILGQDAAGGIYHIGVEKISSTKVNLIIRTRFVEVTLQSLRTLLWTAIAGIAKDVAEIDRIQSLRKLLPKKSTSTGM